MPDSFSLKEIPRKPFYERQICLAHRNFKENYLFTPDLVTITTTKASNKLGIFPRKKLATTKPTLKNKQYFSPKSKFSVVTGGATVSCSGDLSAGLSAGGGAGGLEESIGTANI